MCVAAVWLLQERVLRHYLQHDMSAYKDLDLGTDATTGEADGSANAPDDSDKPTAADADAVDDTN